MSQDVISLVIDSFWKILLPGLTVTIPLTRQLPAFFYSLPRGSLKTATIA